MSLSGFVTALPELIGSAVAANPLLGYGAIALVMLLENVFPPIPSELIMPLAGFYVHEGRLALVPVVLAGLLGTVLGAWFWYGVGRLINEERLEHWISRHGRWLGIEVSSLARSRRWFQRHGAAVVFWGRLIPGIRTFVSVPAGIELMPQPSFLLWTTAGSLLWTLALTLAGRGLGAGYGAVAAWIEPLADLVKVLLAISLALALLWLVLRIVSQLRRG
ncbi:MAG: DedA family protein [Cyanobacteriota bacterium]|jgi:membrane protein DedA with SNARE-associated domain